jgi:hypothetical protein
LVKSIARSRVLRAETAAFVGPREADQAVGAVVVLGQLEAGAVVLGEGGGLVVDVLDDPELADLLGAPAVEVVLEAAQDTPIATRAFSGAVQGGAGP